jgi:hypothetical protein
MATGDRMIMAASAIPRPIVAMRIRIPKLIAEINTIIADHSRSDSKEEQEATNCEAVIPGEEAPYGGWFGIVAGDCKKIRVRIAGTHRLKGIILSRHCRLR